MYVWHFCWCRGFCHRTESDLFLFLITLDKGISPRSRSQCTHSQNLYLGYINWYIGSRKYFMQLLSMTQGCVLSWHWSYLEGQGHSIPITKVCVLAIITGCYELIGFGWHLTPLLYTTSALELHSPVTRGEWLFAQGELINHVHSPVRESLIMYLFAFYNTAFELESVYSIYLILCVIFLTLHQQI